MGLSKKQAGVLRGMLIGLSLAVLILLFGVRLNPFDFNSSLSIIDRLATAIVWCLVPMIFLSISIARLAKHRFFTPEDIDGSGLSNGSAQAKLLQAQIQNTLEQATLAVFVYCIWSVVMPSQWLSAVPMASLTFGLGRILFFKGYKKGAPSRAVGFALGFYSSILMMFSTLGYLVWQSFS